MPRRTFGALLSTVVSVAAALAFSAPLLHAHLDAAGLDAQGLCGEHVPDAPAGGDTAGACPVCLAGHHARVAAARAATSPEAPTRATPTAGVPEPLACSSLPARPGAPRAPPLSA